MGRREGGGEEEVVAAAMDTSARLMSFQDHSCQSHGQKLVTSQSTGEELHMKPPPLARAGNLESMKDLEMRQEEEGVGLESDIMGTGN